jgi:branched-chain amino acid transport system ATP-binding protein
LSKILEVIGLEASYGDLRVLHGLDFQVEQGGMTALLGANGAGKTTTLRALCGMIKRSRGRSSYDGKDISPQVDRGRSWAWGWRTCPRAAAPSRR